MSGDVPEAMVWGCEQERCDFWTNIQRDAERHSDEKKHSLALRPEPPEAKGRKITHFGMSAWTLLKPAVGCEVCGAGHEPPEPHDPESFYWHTQRHIEGKPPPTWEDALAHVDDPLYELWRQALAEHNVTVPAREGHEKLGVELGDDYEPPA